MKKIISIVGIVILSFTIFLSGCLEENTENTNVPENIDFESDIVELAYSNFTKDIQDGKVVSVSVEYLFTNIVERNLNINVTVEFYDSDNGLLYTGGPKTISLPQGWTEQGLGPANIITYDGEDASKVEKARVVVEES